jgi:hypothetical protein
MTTAPSPIDTTEATPPPPATAAITSDDIPPQSESESNPTLTKEYSRSSIKTAKKILNAVKQHRKTDATKDGKVETLQLKKKEKGKKMEEAEAVMVQE